LIGNTVKRNFWIIEGTYDGIRRRPGGGYFPYDEEGGGGEWVLL